MKRPQTLPVPVINLFFAIGVLSAVAFRALIIVQHVRPALFRSVWYGGLFGYIIFFAYRYAITRKRRQAIGRFRLIEKIQGNACLSDEDREVAVYLLSSLVKSRENLNYLIIFLLSILAVAMDLFLVSSGR
ncbi:MAG: hypothetical protein COX17_06105 [Deltaproteobacteria bacterium CG23_combo_of_CG06-09_8_20_14_all_60_8]|nr:MAG: hypothetical protein AUK28_09775 [Desulfobacterales bacterium CG2_30_60_27]PIP43600.1 MAG: hypothetical protein COX17_06105 [Deltaproteobacteria bacterium CG23_combo_of_CG06-09_8_20_14_all_60_8]